MEKNNETRDLTFLQSLTLVVILSGVLAVLAYLILQGGRFYGLFVLACAIVPVVGAKLVRLKLQRLIPDILFGSIDTGLLTVAALIGAAGFGVIGAIVGGVIGDAITDGIAGFFEGGISEWLRRHGIDESRTALGSCFGKTTGCLLGSGLVLFLASVAGVGQTILVSK
ncbi:MAG: hypothetical protein ABIH23_23800 [bacterium]